MYTPKISFSKASSSSFAYSPTSGNTTSNSFFSSSPAISKRLSCPSKAFFRSLALFSRSAGPTAIFCRLVPGRESSAPDLIKFSSVRRFTSLWVIRLIKSSMVRNFPFFARSSRMASTTGFPTLLIAERP